MNTRVLPENPSLEFDRKRAKQLLAAARAQDAAATERLRLHPHFSQAAASLIAEQVKLHHAQLVIAREYGFASWPRLRAHVLACRASDAERAVMLLQTSLRGDLRTARQLLEREPLLATHDAFTASACGEPQWLGRALQRDPSLARRAGGPLGCEPIVYACFSRFMRADAARAERIVEGVRLLLEQGADPNAHYLQTGGSSDKRQTCLYGAAGIANHPELTRLLLTAGADVNELEPASRTGEYRAMEALYHACEFSDVRCLSLLLTAQPHRASVSYCLGRVLDFDNEAGALLFLEHGADPNTRIPWAEHRSHLHKAAKRGRSPNTVQAMLEHGGDPNALDAIGLSPYRYAVRFGHRALATIFEAHGADPASLTAEDHALGELACGQPLTSRPGFVPDAELLEQAIRRGQLPAIRALLDAGADIEARREHPPLHTAAYYGQADALALLLERGASTRALNAYGDIALGTVLFGSRACVDPEGGIGTRLPEEIEHGDYPRCAQLLIAAGSALPPGTSGCSDAVAEVLRRHGVADEAEDVAESA